MTDNLLLSDHDPFGYLEDLREAWADLQTDPDASACFLLARAKGRCLLAGIAGAEVMRPIPVDLARSAIAESIRRLADWKIEAENLGAAWDTCVDPAEADSLCVRLLSFRMDILSVGLVVDEAYLASPDELGGALDEFEASITQFDGVLREQSVILSTLASTPLLDNWRSCLGGEYRDALPWWLDGQLEDTARRVEQETNRSLSALRRGPRLVIPWPSEGRLAAATTAIEGATPGSSLHWVSPDGRLRAELILPKKFTPEEDVAPRPLNFTTCDSDAPAQELAGWAVHLGGEALLIDEGHVLIRLADLRFAESITLSRGEIRQRWPLARQGD